MKGVFIVHCRIGSLEICPVGRVIFLFVHCRIGSLESLVLFVRLMNFVHCRIGSLEIANSP